MRDCSVQVLTPSGRNPVLARRFAPFVVVVLAQLVVIGVAPSISPKAQETAAPLALGNSGGTLAPGMSTVPGTGPAVTAAPGATGPGTTTVRGGAQGSV